MQLIPTTATAVQKIKSAAKAISRTTDISHTNALEQVSKAHGYEGWYHVQHCQKTSVSVKDESTPIMSRAQAASSYFEYLATQPRSPVLPNAIKGNTFHEVSIEGQRFAGKITSTGDIYLFKVYNKFGIDFSPSVQIGVTSIRKREVDKDQLLPGQESTPMIPDLKNPQPHGEWWICKYDAKQGRIDLGGMTEEGRNALALEFGLPIIPHGNLPKPTDPWNRFAYGSEDTLFYASPSYQALLAWAKLHPKKARASSAKSIYLKNWLRPSI